jgi:hypothetical protein
MNTITWLYRQVQSEPCCLWSVGFYDPKGQWHPESEYAWPHEAAKRVRWLNGGTNDSE